MNRNSILSFIIVAVGTGALLATTANSQLGTPKSYVSLQPTTPGTSQSGHINVSGSVLAGQHIGGGAGLTGVNADLFDGLNSTAFLTGVPVPLLLTGATGGDVIFGENNSNVLGSTGIKGVSNASSGRSYGVRGENSSSQGIGVYGTALSTNGTLTYGVFGISAGLAGRGVFGVATSLSNSGARGVEGNSYSTNGIGVFGQAISSNGPTYGGWFQSDSTSGTGVLGYSNANGGDTRGVYGLSSSPTGTGVYGEATASAGVSYGIFGRTSSTGGNAVFGIATAPTGITAGGSFQSSSVSGLGLYAGATAPTGTTFGGEFVNSSTSGYGVYAHANATSGSTTGVRGESSSPDGVGVFGYNLGLSGTADGVYGRSDSPSGRGVVGFVPSGSGVTYAVIGWCSSPSGYGNYSVGNTGASGVKSFRIDHPFDPENKYLLHYSAEGPEPMNHYSGSIVTDSRGYASIELPEYFSQINRDARVQLTVVDESDSDSFVQVKVVQKVIGNSFRIRTSAPNVEVFWRVEAVRNDLWMQKHGAPVEVEKQGRERGTYQHPELYGMPKERGMNYRPEVTTVPPKKDR